MAETTEPTIEETEELKARMMEFYQSELPLLRLQEEFERLNANIEESRLRGILAMQKMAQFEMMQKQAQEKADSESKKNKNKK